MGVRFSASLSFSNNLIFVCRIAVFFAALSIAAAFLPGCKIFDPRTKNPDAVTESRNLRQEGILALERGDCSNAEQCLAQAVLLNEKDSEIRRSYSEALWRNGKKQEAIEQLSEAMKLAGKSDTKILLSLSEKSYDLAYYDAAIDFAEKAIDSADAKWASTNENRQLISRAWVIRARVHWRNNELEPALKDYHKAISLCPKDQGLLSELATLQTSMGQPERALATWHSVSRIWPLDQEPQHVVFGRGEAYMAMRQYHLACDQFDLANQRWPEDIKTYCRLAEAQLACGRVQEAAVIARKAVEIEPNNQMCLAVRQQVQIAMTQHQPAVR